VSVRANIRSTLLVSSVVAATTVGFAIQVAAGESPPAHHTVVIEAMRFDPQELTLNAGDTVLWVNHDPFPHTVSAVGRQFDSHDIAAGASWKYVARRSGTYAYVCSLHPNMPGTLQVN
jgi:plastocyanin